MKLLTKTAIIFALATPASTILAADFYETINASPGEKLNLATHSGSIRIRTHNEDSVIVDVDVSGKHEDEFTVTVDRRGDEIVVLGEKENRNSWNGLNVKFDVVVPKNFELTLRTAGGSIDIDDLEGNVEANTSGGSISVGDIIGDIDLHTSGGSIRTDNIYGEIDAHTSGGSIDVTFAQQPSENASLTTSGGSIRASFPENVAIDIDASTSGGRVKSEFEVDGRVKKQSIRGQINGGGPQIDLRTSGGSVSIYKK
ncbi:DUF4097 family beta strand repeat-containing protein [Alteromonas sediminis]|nr:DUF4097 family beta strand repeat-containing protein [Alteromonas sediminis]